MSFVHLPPYRVELAVLPKSGTGVIDWGVSSYGIPALWSRTKGLGVTVAIVDSGVAPHPDLKHAVLDHRNFSSDSVEVDTVGHGTHVAGVIAANGGMHGIAPDAKLLSLKVLGHSGMGSQKSVAEGVCFAADAGAQICCMSLGTAKPEDRLHAAIKYAYDKGVIVICAAGNDGGPVNYPAAFMETIGVGAVDKHGKACEFSSRGKEILVAAPGEEITSCWLDGGYATLSGTSMAAPFVAGVLALYVSSLRGDEKIDRDKIAKALSQTCVDAGDAGRDSLYGWGLIDPHRLVNYQAIEPVAGVTIWIPGGKVV